MKKLEQSPVEKARPIAGQVIASRPIQDVRESMISGKSGGSRPASEPTSAKSLYEQVLEAYGLPSIDSKSLISGKSGGSIDPKDKEQPKSLLTVAGTVFPAERHEPKSDPETQTTTTVDSDTLTPTMSTTLSNFTYTGSRFDDSYGDDAGAE